MKSFTDYQLFVLEKGQICCSDVRKVYGDYFEGELPSSVRGRIDAHMEECPKCQHFAATYRLTVELARELHSNRQYSNQLPAEVQRRLREKLNARLGINLPMP